MTAQSASAALSPKSFSAASSFARGQVLAPDHLRRSEAQNGTAPASPDCAAARHWRQALMPITTESGGAKGGATAEGKTPSGAKRKAIAAVHCLNDQ
jgi:hypothetical protein